MTLGELNELFKELNLPDSMELYPFDGMRYDIARRMIEFLDRSETAQRTRQVCMACGCTPDVARSVLQNTNWNPLLAIVTVRRQNHGSEEGEYEDRQRQARGQDLQHRTLEARRGEACEEVGREEE